jgi:hypothetical protein
MQHTAERRARSRRRSASWWGVVLVAVRILGFIFAETSFAVSPPVNGQELVVFEVNGWHNLVHIATGALLLLAAPKEATAATAALIFGLAYAAITVWGFIDGTDVAVIVPVNTADNLLHLGLAIVALLAAVASGALSAKRRSDRTATA